MRPLTEIIVHCAATRPGWMEGATADAKVAEIRRWHVEENGWADIAYHFIIDRDGSVVAGRPLDRAGAHVRGRNRTSIGVCLIGGHGSSQTDAFADHFTPEQDTALRALIEQLQDQHPSIRMVTGHSTYSAKACPGFQVARWLARKAPARTSPIQSTTLWAAGSGAGATLASAGTLLGQLTPTAQLLLVAAGLVTLLAFAWIARERLKAWARGQR